ARYGGGGAPARGFRRDRDRVRRSLEVIAAHPVWFAGAGLRRAAEMLDYAGADAPPVERAGAIDAAVLDALHEPGQGRAATHLWGGGPPARLRPRLASRQARPVGRAPR